MRTTIKRRMMINYLKTFQMKKLSIILIAVMTACSGLEKTDQHGNENSSEQQHTATAVELKNGRKWKADEATKKNVAAMMHVVSDSSYAGAAKRKELHENVQSKIDSLISQCRMKGAEHDALHVWLGKVLKDMKELKDADNEYGEAHAALKKDIESFYLLFE